MSQFEGTLTGQKLPFPYGRASVQLRCEIDSVLPSGSFNQGDRSASGRVPDAVFVLVHALEPKERHPTPRKVAYGRANVSNGPADDRERLWGEAFDFDNADLIRPRTHDDRKEVFAHERETECIDVELSCPDRIDGGHKAKEVS